MTTDSTPRCVRPFLMVAALTGRIFFPLILLLFCCTLSVKALNGNPCTLFDQKPPYETFRNIVLPADAGSVHCFIQDRSGMMWLGTRNGLFSYDGFSLHTYRSVFGADGNVINCMMQIDKDRLCLGTDYGLQIFNLITRRFSKVKGMTPAVREVRAIAITGRTLWIGTHTNGLFSYDMKMHRLQNHTIGGRTIPLIYALQPAAGKLFIGSYRGLSCFDGRAWWVGSGLSGPLAVYSLSFDRDTRSLWIGTDGSGLFRYDLNTGVTNKTPIGTEKVVKSIIQDGKDNVLAGTEAGIIIYNKVDGSLRQVKHSSRRDVSLCNDMVWSTFRDRDSNLWFGTDRGVSVYSEQGGMRTVPLSEITEQTYGNLFTSISKDKDDSYWLGGENGLLHIGRNDAATWFRADGGHTLRNNHIREIYNDADGSLWIATDGGMARYNRAAARFDYFDLVHPSLSYGTRWCYDIFDDGRGRLWVASYLGGLFVVDKRKLSAGHGGRVKADTVLLGCPVYVISRLNSHTLVLNTQKGLAMIDTGTFRTRFFKAYDDKMAVFRGEIWHSAVGRLYRLDVEGRRREVPYDRGKAERIYTFVSEGKRLWFTTSEGIYYYDSRDNQVHKYAAVQNGFLTGYYDASQKTIVWGGNDCLAILPVSGISLSGMEPRRVAVTSISANGRELIAETDFERELDDDGTVTINLKRRENLTFELSCFRYMDNSRKEFYYNLDNSGHWDKIETGQNTLTLAGLSGGTHSLLISDRNPVTDRNALISSMKVRIPYPWYAGTAAIVFYIFALILAVVLIFIYLQCKNRRKFERLERERFLELSALKMDFFVNISHELKTPLSLIIAPLGRLLTEMREGKVKSALSAIQGNALRLNSLIGKILDFKKIEYESDDTLMLSRVDVCQLIKNGISNFSSVCRQRNIRMSFVSDKDSLVMDVDVLKIESAVINLLSNAVKYVSDNTGSINVSLESTADNVTITVRDNGMGVSEKELPFVFMRYFQGNFGKSVGSGIGLHLVKKFIELHGGSVFAANDHGFVVTMTLPLQIKEERQTITESFEIDKEDSQVVGKRILIIDDNREMVDFLVEALSENYVCLKAYDGEEGIRFVDSERPDLVIVDQMMPRIDGMELVRHVRRNAPTATMPVIMLTAKNDYSIEVESIKAGVDLFLSKPFDLRKLLLHIARLLSKRETIEKCRRVAEISNPDFTDSETPMCTDEDLLRKITASIERNMAKEGFNVENLATDIGVSQKQLYRKLKQLTGMTPVNYMRSLRLKKAYALLSQPGFTVTEVLFMIGISNASYFTKCFTEEYGLTPRELVKRTNSGQNAEK